MVATGSPVIAGGPLRRARAHVRGQLVGAIGVAAQVVPVGEALREQHVHHAAGERAVGARPQRQMQVGLLGGAGAVRVHHHQLGAALLRRHRVLHHVDLGVDRIAAPDHHQVGMLGGLAQVDAALGADAGDPAGVGQRHADGREPARVLHRMAQPLDAVALHQPHGAGVEVRPHRLACRGAPRCAMNASATRSSASSQAMRFELPGALGPGAQQRMGQPVRVVHALGVARHLLADHAGGVGVALRAAHAADGAGVQDLHVQRAGAGAVVRTDRRGDAERGVHVLVGGRGAEEAITRARVFRVRWYWSSGTRAPRALTRRSRRR